jgi:hypothetical protein
MHNVDWCATLTSSGNFFWRPFTFDVTILIGHGTWQKDTIHIFYVSLFVAKCIYSASMVKASWALCENFITDTNFQQQNCSFMQIRSIGSTSGTPHFIKGIVSRDWGGLLMVSMDR